jgi:NADH-quinone oxidoreductase subunit H
MIFEGVTRILVLALFGALVPWVYEFASAKTRADLQARVGPNQVPGSGFFQWGADTIKLILKKRELPHTREWAYLFIKGFLVLLLFFSIPFYDGSAATTSGADFIFILALFLAIAFIDGVRVFLEPNVFQLGQHNGVVARQLSVLPAIGFSLLGVALQTRSFGWSSVSGEFGGQVLALVSFPLGLGNFLLFHVCGLILLGRRPFFLKAENTMSRGGAQEFFEEQLSRLTYVSWVSVLVLLFLGGHLEVEGVSLFWISLFQMGSLAARLLLIMLVSDWVVISLPSMRTDQATDFCWKFLTPIAMLLFVATLFTKVGAYLI